MEGGVSYVHRLLSRGVMYSSALRERRSVSGPACGPSFTRFGSSKWSELATCRVVVYAKYEYAVHSRFLSTTLLY